MSFNLVSISTLDSVVIGGNTPAAASFTTLAASGAVSGAGIVALHAAPGPLGSTTPSTGAFTTMAISGAVSGAGIVALHAAPGPLGSTTPSTGAFTTLAASGAVSGAGIIALHAAPGPIGSTTASTGAFTTLAASGAVSGAGIVALHAAPGPIGSTTASTGAFTTLSASSTVSGAGITTLLTPYALLASPVFTGDPTAPTAAAGDNDTSIATTAFVTSALAASKAVGANVGDANVTLTVGTSSPIQIYSTTLTANRTVTLSTTGAVNGNQFRVVRTGLGSFTLSVGGLKTMPSATAAYAEVTYNGTAWILTGYGTL